MKKGKLHEAIDRMIQTTQKELRYHEKRKDTSNIWKAWSKAVESRWIDDLQLERRSQIDQENPGGKRDKARKEPMPQRIVKKGRDKSRQCQQM